MRRAAVVALLLLFAPPAWAAEEPSGCDKFKWNIEHERAALTAAGSRQARLGERDHGDAVKRYDPDAGRAH